jgi:hypothetical protein
MAETFSPTVSISSTTSGASSYVFPKDMESLSYYTKIKFYKYERANAGVARPSKKETGTIVLPIPQRLPEGFCISYNDRTLGLLGGSQEDYKGIIRDVSKKIKETDQAYQKGWSDLQDYLVSGVKGQVKDMDSIKSVARRAMALMPRSLSDSQITNTLIATVGAVPNPHLTTIFNGVNLRTFQFEWSFSPRSEQEAKTLVDMINFIRTRALPKFTDNTYRFALDFPDECEISFNGVQGVDSVRLAVVSDVGLEWAPQGPSFRRGGHPTEVIMRLTVHEVEIRTREDYDGTNTSTSTTNNTGTKS